MNLLLTVIKMEHVTIIYLYFVNLLYSCICSSSKLTYTGALLQNSH